MWKFKRKRTKSCFSKEFTMIKTVSAILLLSSLAFANPFGAGNKSIGITVGSGSVSYSTTGLITTTYVENYYIVGVNADFFCF